MSEDVHFQRALEITLDFEGEESDDPHDAGGFTRWGIAQAWHPEIDVRQLDRQGAVDLLYTDYWRPIHGAALPWPLAAAMFDYAVHSGPGDAIKALQRGLGVLADGRVGRVTLGALAKRKLEAQPRAMHLTLLGLQRRRIRELFGEAQARPESEGYLAGWMLRVAELGVLCGVELGRTPWDPWQEDQPAP